MFQLSNYLEERARRIDHELAARLPPEDQQPAVLHRAMRYAALAGGKRIRPILCLAAAEAAGGSAERALMPSLALELLHTYTLVHDDLPCMDDDDLRRGKPTCHKVFGEANAILAGDALLTLAFEWLAAAPATPPYSISDSILELARASGHAGVIGGQVEDLDAEGEPADAARLEFIHSRKTGALIRASVRLGAISAGAAPEELQKLSAYGELLGLAFQVADDILNATSTVEDLGKAVRSDAARQKQTYVRMYSLEEAQRKGRELADAAGATLRGFPGPTEPLLALARFVIERTA